MSATDTIQIMRNIIRDLRQTELQNARLAGELSQEEVRTAAALNQNIGNVAELAAKDRRLAGALHDFADAGTHAAQQLAQLETMLDQLGNRF